MCANALHAVPSDSFFVLMSWFSKEGRTSRVGARLALGIGKVVCRAGRSCQMEAVMHLQIIEGVTYKSDSLIPAISSHARVVRQEATQIGCPS